jgi:peptidoglycan hydrolase-like protein with peptidoglycan-binding domain
MDQNATVGLGGSPAGGVGGDWNDVQRQQFLVSIGLDTGGVGNGWGPMSEAATKTFQSWVGLTNDGLFGPATIAVAKTIQQGGKRVEGRSTSEIQQFLTSKGIGVGPIDNQWGPKTSLGTFVYQRSVGFLPDALWGEQTDAKAFPPPPPQTTYPTDGRNASSRPTKDIQQFLISRGYDLGPTGADNDYGPATSVATAKFQEANKLTVDGSWGPQTDAKAVELGGFPNNGPNPVPEGDEASHTPNLVSPTAADFPVWIRFEEKLDQQYVASAATWNTDSFKHYKTQYNPIESHTHWWNEPGKGGTHDGNVDYLNRTKDVSANFVVSAGRVTLTVPLNKNALTTGGRNPYAWKSENDPLMTTSSSDLGYKTMGYLHYIVEKLNPTLQGESIRLHKEFYSTSCSLIDTQKVRAYAEKFRTGELDPATGLPPEPEPEPENETKKEIYEHLEQIARLVDEL